MEITLLNIFVFVKKYNNITILIDPIFIHNYGSPHKIASTNSSNYIMLDQIPILDCNVIYLKISYDSIMFHLRELILIQHITNKQITNKAIQMMTIKYDRLLE